jgi:hypothetical protein
MRAPGSVRLSTQPSAGCFCGEHSGYFGAANPLPQLSGDHAMAAQTECTDVVEVALAATFRYRQNVICVPKTLAHSRESPMPHERQASGAPRTLELAVFHEGVQPAMNAHTPIAF